MVAINEPTPGPTPGAAGMSPSVDAARRHLDAVVGAANLDTVVLADVLIAEALLMETSAPPPPPESQPGSRDVSRDLQRAIELIGDEAALAKTAGESIRLARIVRHLQDALERHERRQRTSNQP